MSTSIKELIQNMNLVVGCNVGCSYFYHEEVRGTDNTGKRKYST